MVLAALVGLVLGLRGRTGEHIDDGAIGDVPPIPATDQNLVALQRKLLGHLAVLHLPGGVTVADAFLRAAVEDDADVVPAICRDHARLAIGDHAASDLCWHAVVLANVGTVEVAHGFLHACAALRGRMRHGGNLVWDGVLRVTGMGPGQGVIMTLVKDKPWPTRMVIEIGRGKGVEVEARIVGDIDQHWTPKAVEVVANVNSDDEILGTINGPFESREDAEMRALLYATDWFDRKYQG